MSLSKAYLGAMTYLIALAAAEALTVFSDPRLGMLTHGLLVFSLLAQAAASRDEDLTRFLSALALAPLLRLVSLALPLQPLPLAYAYLAAGAALLLPVGLAARLAGLSRQDVGLHGRGLRVQLLAGATGAGLGYVEYLILSPRPLLPEPGLSGAWLPLAALLAFNGLLEELIYRGLVQGGASSCLGRAGLPYSAALFAVMHLGYRSLVNVLFVFSGGLAFGWLVLRTRSIVGVGLSHGLANITVYLLLPLLLSPAPSPAVAPLPSGSAPDGQAKPSATPFAPLRQARTPGQVALPVLLLSRPEVSGSPAPTPEQLPQPGSLPVDEGRACGPPEGWVSYIVQPGDTLFGLGLALASSADELISANCLEGDLILAGQELFVPPRP